MSSRVAHRWKCPICAFEVIDLSRSVVLVAAGLHIDAHTEVFAAELEGMDGTCEDL